MNKPSQRIVKLALACLMSVASATNVLAHTPPGGTFALRGGNNPPTGTFALHGRPIDVLPDGKTLLYVRARYYDPANGRWLQRDPKGHVDGPNLYESFRGNATRNVDPMGTEVWAEARLVKTTLNGVPVWRADYTLNKDGVSLGFGGLLIPSAVESTHAGTEFFRFTDDPRQLRRIQAQVESLRQIIEAGQIADIQIASLEQGIKTSATVGVALPVAAVAAPAAGAAFSSTTIGITTTTVAGNVAAASLTGGISLGAGQPSGEALIGGGAGDVAIAGLEGFAIGSVFSAPFGLAAPVGVSSAVTAQGVGGAQIGIAATQTSTESSTAALLRQLRQAGGELAVPRGAITTQEITALSRLSGNEFALVRVGGRTGPRVLIEGTPVTTNVPTNSRLILHVQPGATGFAAQPSALDRLVLTQTRGGLGQRSSVIITSEGNFSVRFGPTRALDNETIELFHLSGAP